jgi:hypothetical protein
MKLFERGSIRVEQLLNNYAINIDNIWVILNNSNLLV